MNNEEVLDRGLSILAQEAGVTARELSLSCGMLAGIIRMPHLAGSILQVAKDMQQEELATLEVCRAEALLNQKHQASQRSFQALKEEMEDN